MFLVSIIFLMTGAGGAAVLYVPSEYDTIQEAIDAAQDGDTIYIAKGIYQENNIQIAKRGELIIEGATDNPLDSIIDGCRAKDINGNCIECLEYDTNGICKRACNVYVRHKNWDHVTCLPETVNSLANSSNIDINIDVIDNGCMEYEHSDEDKVTDCLKINKKNNTCSIEVIERPHGTCLAYCFDYGKNICTKYLQHRVFDVIPNGSGLDLTIKNLTVQNGKAIDRRHGAGIRAKTDDAPDADRLNLTFENLVVRDNTTLFDVGGIAILGNINATLKNNEIYNNSAGADSGGLLAWPLNHNDIILNMTGNKIYKNSAPMGGGIHLYNSSWKVGCSPDCYHTKLTAFLEDNKIYENSATHRDLGGGGLRIITRGQAQTDVTLRNNTIENNTAPKFGAGILVFVRTDGYSSITAVNLHSYNNQIINNSKGKNVAGAGVGVYLHSDVPDASPNKSVFEFEYDTLFGNGMDDLALSSDPADRDSAEVHLYKTMVCKMRRYGDGTWLGKFTIDKGPLIPDTNNESLLLCPGLYVPILMLLL